MRTQPPKWTEAFLRVFLQPDVFATVSGDLLEQYRDSILPARGLEAADRWYLAQVLGFVLPRILPWAALFAGAFVARGVFDVLLPTADFALRSQISTGAAAGLLFASGFFAAWRSGSVFSGVAAGFATTAAACVMSVGLNAALLALWHDPRVMDAVAASGGVEEAFLLPVMLIAPGVLLGGIGGFVGARAKRLAPSA